MSALKQYRIEADSAAGLVADIEQAVARGALAPGEPLPSVRRMAAEVGLSPATIATALAELRRRGVVLTEPRRGTRVGERPPLALTPAALAVPPGVRDLSRGNPDPALLPDLAAALRDCELPTRLYGEEPELQELTALARAALRAEGVAAQEVCVVGGALDGIERVLGAWLRPGASVAVESPGYASLYDLLRAAGIAMVPVAVDERGMLPERLGAALARGVGAVVITPRGQNPTGAALDAARAQELRAVLGEHPEVMVVEDDHLGPLAGAPMHSLSGGRERWAAARSVAKSLGPDLRLAVLAGDEATLARVRGRQMCGPGWVSHVLQRLVARLWADEQISRRLAEARSEYARRRESLLAALAARGLDATGRSGLNVWVPVGDEAAAVAALLARGWAVAPGARYRLAAGPAAVRITTATLAPGESEQLAGDIAAALTPAATSRHG